MAESLSVSKVLFSQNMLGKGWVLGHGAWLGGKDSFTRIPEFCKCFIHQVGGREKKDVVWKNLYELQPQRWREVKGPALK